MPCARSGKGLNKRPSLTGSSSGARAALPNTSALLRRRSSESIRAQTAGASSTIPESRFSTGIARLSAEREDRERTPKNRLATPSQCPYSLAPTESFIIVRVRAGKATREEATTPRAAESMPTAPRFFIRLQVPTERITRTYYSALKTFDLDPIVVKSVIPLLGGRAPARLKRFRSCRDRLPHNHPGVSPQLGDTYKRCVTCFHL